MNKAKQVKSLAEQLIGQGDMDVVDTAFIANYVAHAENREHNGQTGCGRMDSLRITRTTIIDATTKVK